MVQAIRQHDARQQVLYVSMELRLLAVNVVCHDLVSLVKVSAS